MIANIRAKFVKAITPQSRQSRENAYLNLAEDRYDLEYRQRQVDRGLFKNYY